MKITALSNHKPGIFNNYMRMFIISHPVYIIWLLQVNPEQSGIKFADFKTSGVSLRSQRVSFCHEDSN